MLLIATDEAGYGPKLGPLVIAATVWRVPDVDGLVGYDELTKLFAPLGTRRSCGEQVVVVDDSKAVFKPSSRRTPKQAVKETGTGLGTLHAVVSASLHWCDRSDQTLSQWLPHSAPQDIDAIARAPWFGELRDECFINPSMTSGLLEQWRATGIELLDVQARIVTAETFNLACEHGNKADLLSESTLGLVRSLVDHPRNANECIAVYCDRHGGRRYYGGVLQHLFPDAQLQIIAEAKQQSAYRLITGETRMDVHFTVKGDSFTPVALASMHAKYLRERLMESFNAFFAARHCADSPLIPTAGYPGDADRFLADIEPIIQREQIDPRKLIRSR